ncbi:TetR/AcrR family transcriptional regulator [Actinomadura madurae]|uniref:TetR/AcrR family transcriptional regulator n=1 Tax=Actinomadura madurae TaxID=1993 RepID=UPI0020D1F65B|nr:TetR/AcrR family transcriptional regulator [Actinomadura madurae]MCQ0004253.1 TetR/AcrR family transcriptional regulator [Actinomadura madurae]
MGTDSRERMVRSAAFLFRERGYSGTGFRDVIAHSGAPRGSIYHHFPEGKAQLAEEAVRYAGEFLNAGILAATESGDAASAVDAFVGWWRQVLIKSEFRAGCPVVAVTVECHDDAPQLAAAAAAAFGRWQDTLATGLGNARRPGRARVPPGPPHRRRRRGRHHPLPRPPRRRPPRRRRHRTQGHGQTGSPRGVTPPSAPLALRSGRRWVRAPSPRVVRSGRGVGAPSPRVVRSGRGVGAPSLGQGDSVVSSAMAWRART